MTEAQNFFKLIDRNKEQNNCLYLGEVHCRAQNKNQQKMALISIAAA